jgi:guanidinopropionase
MGLHDPRLGLHELHVGVLGVPYDGSVSHAAGAAEAPAVLRRLSATAWPHTENRVGFAALKLRDLGDVAVDQGDPLATQRAVTAAVAPVVRAGAIPLVLGGDHSITSAAVAAFGDLRDIGVLWFDSHPDVMDSFGSLRGKTESRWSHACPLRRMLELSGARPENLLLVGVRDFLPEEARFVRAANLEVVYARDLRCLSADQLVERIAGKFAGLRSVYVSFDIDVLDPAHAPGTGVPMPGGLSTRYLYDIILGLGERTPPAQRDGCMPRVAGLDVVEVAPPLDVGNITSLAALGIITGMLGHIALQLGVSTRL